MNGILPSVFSCSSTCYQEFKESAIVTCLALSWIAFIGSVLAFLVLQNVPLGPLNALFFPLSPQVTYSLLIGSIFSLAIMHGLFFHNLPEKIPLTLHQKADILNKIARKNIPDKLLAGHFWTFNFRGMYLVLSKDDEGGLFLAKFKEDSQRQQFLDTKGLKDGRKAFAESPELEPAYIEAKFGKNILYQSIPDFSLDDLEENEKIAWKYRTKSKSIPTIHILAVRGLDSLKMLYFRKDQALLTVSNNGYRHFENRVDKDMEREAKIFGARLEIEQDCYIFYKLKSKNDSRFVVTWKKGKENKSKVFCQLEKLTTYIQRFHDEPERKPIQRIMTYYI